VIAEKFLGDWNIEAQTLACASCEVKNFAMGPSKFQIICFHQLNIFLISAPEVIEWENILTEYSYSFYANHASFLSTLINLSFSL